MAVDGTPAAVLLLMLLMVMRLRGVDGKAVKTGKVVKTGKAVKTG